MHSIDNLVLSQITIILFDCDSRWPDRWPDQESQVKGLHFLLLTLQRVINCFIITLFSQYCKFIGKPPNTNSNAYFDRTWTEPMILDIQGKLGSECLYLYVCFFNKLNGFFCFCMSMCLFVCFLYVLELSRSSSKSCNSSFDSDAKLLAAIVAKHNWGVQREWREKI